VNIVGAGLAGALLSILLARRGFPVRVFERRPDPRSSQAESGRSINLALAARGIQTLERAGLMHHIQPLLIPMTGRMVHDLSGSQVLHPYGQRPGEVIYSVGRAALNRVLIEAAARHAAVELHFEQSCVAVDTSRDMLRLRDGRTGKEHETALAPTIATDGAGSAVRASLAAASRIKAREDFLDHDYKELTIPAIEGRPALEPHALHVWPRGGFMLIALPNTDGTFTATLFLARSGSNSFASLGDDASVRALFHREFADVVPLIPDLLKEFRTHPQGQLGTVRTQPWHVGGRVLLLGDAAHAIVPFHGQGMNAAFEDCLALDSLLERHGDGRQKHWSEQDWNEVFASFYQQRLENTEAIAQMALENYTEMRDTVLEARFVRQKQLALELELRFPRRFIPRYSMVMFHPEIPYAEALRRGKVQAEILDVLDESLQLTGQLDLAAAQRRIEERLTPL
jgi:kynurenine 3-monooxygenase